MTFTNPLPVDICFEVMFGMLVNALRSAVSELSEYIRRCNHRFASTLKVVDLTLNVLAFIASAGCISCMIVYIGYDHTSSELRLLRWGVGTAQIIFVANILFNLIFNQGRTFKGAVILNHVVNIMVLLSAVPMVLQGHLPSFLGFLRSEYFLFTAMIVYSLVEISYGVMSALSRRMNPSIILSVSFLVFIVGGAFLLMLPRCSYLGIDFVDALFLATSAVCITGLSPIDIATNLTPFGLLVLALLIQIGALGVMTFTSFFALFFSGASSIYSQLLLSDIIYSKSMSALIPTLLYVLGFTVGIEAIGTVMIFFSIHGTLAMNLEEEIIFSAFHALSAFCNAGFSNLPGGLSNPALLYGNKTIYWVFSLLIVAGAIGFPILTNIRDVMVTYARRLCHWIMRRPRGSENAVHIYSVNTKIVFATFFALFLFGAGAFLILEDNNTLSGMTTSEKITQAVFNSVTPRRAGFSSVNPADFLSPTLLIVMFLMWVGGASQSTAGGIKVNTFAAILINLRSIIFGQSKVTVFCRTISLGSIRRANAVVATSIISFALYSIILVTLEPQLPVRSVLFETLSALFTVGSSLGITDSLCPASKVVLSTAMFLGRVGILSMVTGLVGRRHLAADYPTDNIIIN